MTATPAELAHALAGDGQVIDVRTAEEYAAGHVAGSQFMPLFAVPLRMTELDRRRPVYIVCQSGGRAGQAGQYLEEHGYDVRVLGGGLAAWTAEGRPVASGSRAYA